MESWKREGFVDELSDESFRSSDEVLERPKQWRDWRSKWKSVCRRWQRFGSAQGREKLCLLPIFRMQLRPLPLSLPTNWHHGCWRTASLYNRHINSICIVKVREYISTSVAIDNFSFGNSYSPANQTGNIPSSAHWILEAGVHYRPSLLSRGSSQLGL